MKGSLRFIYLISFVSICMNGVAQGALLRKADLAEKKGDYAAAVSFYEKALSRGYELDFTEKVNLAKLYYALGSYEQSRDYYQLVEEQDSLSARDLFNYSHSLVVLGDDSGSNKVLEKVKMLYPNDSRVELLNRADQVRNVSLFDDFHALVDSVGNVVHVIEAEGMAYGMRLGSTYDELVRLSDLSSVDSLLFSDWEFNQGGLAFLSEDELILTLNLNRKGRMVFDGDRSHLHLYRLKRDSLGVWSDPEYLDINVAGYNTANPALSPAGDYLYFASDRPGGYGQSDLYRVSIDQTGTFGEVEHLGKEVNTEGRESFVFIDTEGVLYFSSDGYPGKGGMDVYAVELSSEEQEVFNLGSPINTEYNDYAYSRYGSKGYVSTDRAGYLVTWAYDLEAPIELTDELEAMLDLGLANAVSFEQPIRLKVLDEQSEQVVWEESVNRLTTDNIKVDGLTYGNRYRFEVEGKGQLNVDPQRFVATNSPVQANVLKPSTDVISSSVGVDLSDVAPLAGEVEVVVKDKDGAVVYAEAFSSQPGSIRLPDVTYGERYEVMLRNGAGEVLLSQVQVSDVSQAASAGLPSVQKVNTSAALTAQANLRPLLFAFDEASLSLSTEEMVAYLEVLSRAQSVRLEGHTDRQGDTDYNLGLAQRRVDFMAELFRSAGLQVPISTEAKGEENPAVDCGADGMACSIEVRKKNRRVEVFLEF